MKNSFASGVFAPLKQLATELIELVAPPLCAGCAEPTATHPSFCPTCRAQFERAEYVDDDAAIFAGFVQDGPLKTAIHRAKFGRDRSCAHALGLLLREVIPEKMRECAVVVAVPLHSERLGERGFNQAGEIARALGIPVIYDGIERVRATRPQARLSRDERESNVRDAFVLKRAELFRDKRVLLVDDVSTTGATLRAARDAILLANPQVVLCAAVGQAVLRNER